MIAKYMRQLKIMGDQHLDIPSGYEMVFWDWFKIKSRIYNSNCIRRNLYLTSIPIVENNFCFKNSYRVSKGFLKRLFYFEGFLYQKNADNCVRHSFNVCKHDSVFDYSMRNKQVNMNDIYVGVKIPLTFARKIHKMGGDYKYIQYSLLVPYFLFSIGYEDYFQYASL